MTLEADLVVDRLRLKRRLTLWRALAVLGFVLALLGAGLDRHHGHLLMSGPHLARLRIDGVITENRDRLDLIDKAAKDAGVRGLILAIDSPGGSVSGGESLHDAIARFAAKKPVVVTMGGVAASAGYMIAVPATRIFASNATLTGSIGVILQSPDVSGLLGKLGIGVDELVSGPLKGQPSIVKPLSPEGRVMLQGVVMDLYGQFVDMVATGRHMDPAKVRSLGDGRPYTGHQALGLGLIDQIGDERDARQWLAKNRQLSMDLPVEPLDRKAKQGWFRTRISSALNGIAVAVTHDAIVALMNGPASKTLVPQGLALDGAISVWQP
ncbi:MAG: signal peptide peptidase SppA [Janthinobacterium lividum]